MDIFSKSKADYEKTLKTVVSIRQNCSIKRQQRNEKIKHRNII